MVCLESKTKEVIAIKMGAKRACFSRLQSEVNVLLVKDGSEAGMFLKTSERSQRASRERWERSGQGFSGLQSEINEPLVINLPLSGNLLSLSSLEHLW
jgi:hypothetical protein